MLEGKKKRTRNGKNKRIYYTAVAGRGLKLRKKKARMWGKNQGKIKGNRRSKRGGREGKGGVQLFHAILEYLIAVLLVSRSAERTRLPHRSHMRNNLLIFPRTVSHLSSRILFGHVCDAHVSFLICLVLLSFSFFVTPTHAPRQAEAPTRPTYTAINVADMETLEQQQSVSFRDLGIGDDRLLANIKKLGITSPTDAQVCLQEVSGVLVPRVFLSFCWVVFG